MQTQSASNGKPDGDPLLDELLDQELLRDLVTKEPVERVKEIFDEFRLMYVALLIFCSTATIQLLPVQEISWLLMSALGCFAVGIPLLCMVLLYKHWIATHEKYDYLQPNHQWVLFMMCIQLVAGSVALVGVLLLFLNVHPVIGWLFFLSAAFAMVIYSRWKASLKANHIKT